MLRSSGERKVEKGAGKDVGFGLFRGKEEGEWKTRLESMG